MAQISLDTPPILAQRLRLRTLLPETRAQTQGLAQIFLFFLQITPDFQNELTVITSITAGFISSLPVF